MKHLLKPPFLRHFIVWGFVAGGVGSASAQSAYTTPYSIFTFAGQAGAPGDSDGTSSNASFGAVQGMATDSSGGIYVADTQNDVIRTITPGGAVSTIAGVDLAPGSANGPVSTATFNQPTGIAVDSVGNIYVADTGNYTIRKISSGVVSTLAGTPGVIGHTDATGASASFAGPQGIAVDSAGNVYVADEGNSTIRKITPAGVVTTVAGTEATHTTGHANGVGSSASFFQPEGVAVDSAGNLYVADTGNSTIRKITPSVSGGVTTWTVTTLAGTALVVGSTDATGAAAQFYYPIGLAVDSGGNVYVADTSNDTIRRVTPAGLTSTLAGQVGVSGDQDGAGGSAQFYYPFALTVDPTGNLYIADTGNFTIRKGVGPFAITQQPQNQTSIVGGSATFTVAPASGAYAYQWVLNGAPITGATSSTYTVSPVETSNSGANNLYAVVVNNGSTSVTSSSATITISNETAPTVTNPASQTVNAGATATFSVTATGGGLSYQWYFDGASIAGATSSTLTLSNAGTEQAGYYAVGVSNQAGLAISNNNSNAGLLTVNYSARLINISARSFVGTGGNILIAGFSIGGTGSKNLLLRGVGPRLAAAPFDVTGTLSNPQLTLFDSVPTAIVTNIGWGSGFTLGPSSVSVSPQSATAALMSSVGAFALPSGSTDSALEVTPPTGGYSSQISGVGGTSGIALAEIYDADTGTPTARLVNLSARADVGVGGNVLIAGFAITGTTSETVLIRGVGPRLAFSPFSLTGTLSNPQLTLYDSSAAPGPLPIATDIGWGNAPTSGTSAVEAGIQPATATVMASVGAFALTSGSADCAMIITLPPGNYTAQVSGISSTTGIALVEVYEVP